MLSNSAFNALLKTLEEPPAHVKFIFATTEIRKVPITILSRCQRFDLRRLDESEICNHLTNILAKEGFEADVQALELISKMSEGSVRDSLSLLDQALSNNNYQKFLSADLVEKMLGLNDKIKVIELLEEIILGNFSSSIEKFNQFYSYSSDISQLITDLMEIIHKITSSKLIANYKLEGYSKFQQDKIAEIAQKISFSSLSRIWQMLSKGSSEVSFSVSPKMSFEMLLARICHLVALPNLKDLVRTLNSQILSENSFESSDFASKSDELPKKETLIKNLVDEKRDEINDEVVNEILRNFEGSKIIN